MDALNRSTEEKPSKKKEYVKEGCSVPVAHRRGYQFRPCLRTKILLCFLDTGHVNGRIRLLHLNFESVCFDQILQDHVRKRRIRYQDHMRVGQALCHDLLWNDCCGTIAFDPSPNDIFIVSKSACILLFYSLFINISLFYQTIYPIHCIIYRYLGFIRQKYSIQRVCGLFYGIICMGNMTNYRLYLIVLFVIT